MTCNVCQKELNQMDIALGHVCFSKPLPTHATMPINEVLVNVIDMKDNSIIINGTEYWVDENKASIIFNVVKL